MSHRIFLEVHPYAPELNKAVYCNRRHIVGRCPAPAINTLQQWRQKTRRCKQPFKYAQIIKHYPVGHELHQPGGTQVAAGQFTGYKAVKIARNHQLSKLAPGGWLQIKFRLVCG